MVVVGRDGSRSQIATWLACPAPPRCPAGTRRCRWTKSLPCNWFPPTTERFCSKRNCESGPGGEPNRRPAFVSLGRTGRQVGADERANGYRVVDHIVDHLAASGVGHLFGVDGANIEDLYDAAHFRDDITAVLAKHEFSAATMADGYSRGGAGLGRGGRDLGRRIAESGCRAWGSRYASRVPVLALVGQPPTALDGRGSFQDTSGRNGSLDARGAVLRGLGVLPPGAEPRRHRRPRCRRRIAAARDGRARGAAAAQGYSAERSIDTSCCRRPGDRISAAASVTRIRSCGRCAVPRGPVTIIAGEQVARDDARAELEQLRVGAAAPGWPPCPTPRTSAARPGRHRRWASPG